MPQAQGESACRAGAPCRARGSGPPPDRPGDLESQARARWAGGANEREPCDVESAPCGGGAGEKVFLSVKRNA